MRSSDLFTAIAEKSRPTATTHSRDRERNPRTAVSHQPGHQNIIAQSADAAVSVSRPRHPSGPPHRAHVAPRSGHVARFVARRSGPGMPVRLPLPSTRIGDGEASSALPRYRVSRSDATRSPGAGSGLIREFEGRGHADPGDRERDTRATRLTVKPQSR
jgi:hypothetical protein